MKFAGLCIVCIVVWGFGLHFSHKYVNSKYGVATEKLEDGTIITNKLNNPALFGDSSGAVNAIFSALAFAGVIFAILLQKKELELQRKELSEHKQEFITQNGTLRLQRFENTFFQMMSLQQEIVSGFSIKYKNNIVEQNIKPTQKDPVLTNNFDLFLKENFRGSLSLVFKGSV